jgi:hypothetical protein
MCLFLNMRLIPRYAYKPASTVASFPGHSPFFNVARRKEGEPGKRNHMRDI